MRPPDLVLNAGSAFDLPDSLPLNPANRGVAPLDAFRDFVELEIPGDGFLHPRFFEVTGP